MWEPDTHAAGCLLCSRGPEALAARRVLASARRKGAQHFLKLAHTELGICRIGTFLPPIACYEGNIPLQPDGPAHLPCM